MRKWLVCLVLPALLLGACNRDSGPPADEDPVGALVSAIRETSAAEQQSITFSLLSTPESLVAASSEEGTPISAEMAETILGSSISIGAVLGEDEQSIRVSVGVPETEGAEVLVIGQDLYARADVRGLASAFGMDTAVIDQFLDSPTAQEFPFLESGVNGEFLKVEGTEELTGGATGTEQLRNQQDQVLDAITRVIQGDSTVEFAGEDDVGDHFVVTTPVRALYDEMVNLATQLGTSPPTETDIPEGDVTFDAWVADGRLAQLELDLLRLAQDFGTEEIPEGVEQLGTRLAFAYEVEDIEPPEDAVTVTGEQIMGLIFGGAFGGGTEVETEVTPEPDEGGGGEELIDCTVYEDLPPETFEGLPQETLDQLEQICPGIVPE